MRRRDLLTRSASAVMAALAFTAGVSPLARANEGEPGLSLQTLKAHIDDDGVVLDYDVSVQLSEALKNALQRGISVVFVVEARLFERRWYWTDKSRRQAVRRWRVTYQPLTRQWRLSIGAFNRHYTSLDEALDALRRSSRWRIAERPDGNADDHYVEFGFRLDARELPRPLQIGLGSQNTWDLSLERQISLQD